MDAENAVVRVSLPPLGQLSLLLIVTYALALPGPLQTLLIGGDALFQRRVPEVFLLEQEGVQPLMDGAGKVSRECVCAQHGM